MTTRKNKPRAKPKPHVFVISDPIFITDHLICCGTTYRFAFDRFKRLLEKQKYTLTLTFEDVRSTTMGRSTMSGHKPTCLWFRDRTPGGGVVAHECLHATYNVLGLSGVSLSDSSEETYAYYLDWMVREIGKRVW